MGAILESEKEAVIQMLEETEEYRKIVEDVSGGSDVDVERKMRHWANKLQERPRGDVLECGIRWAVEARRKGRGEQQEQWRQGGQGEQPAETKGGEWVWQGEEETGGEEDEYRERQGNGRYGQGEETIENENDMNKEDWGHSLERKRANSRRERRERERANWNSGGRIRLSGFGQDHWESETGSWYQDQWWDSGTWREESEAKGFGWMEKRWG